MKNCFAIPKLMYLLRTSPAFKCGHNLAQLTQLMRDTFEGITNVTITHEAWAQTTRWNWVALGYSLLRILFRQRISPHQYPVMTVSVPCWNTSLISCCSIKLWQTGERKWISINPHPLNAIVRNHGQKQLLQDVKRNWSRTQMISI